jgi:hypothetical protein
MISLQRLGRALGLAGPAFLAACAGQPESRGEGAGFLAGIFHGLTAWIALLASIFMPVRPYAFPNAGFWYDAGFITGFSASIVFLVVISIARIGGFITGGH